MKKDILIYILILEFNKIIINHCVWYFNQNKVWILYFKSIFQRMYTILHIIQNWPLTSKQSLFADTGSAVINLNVTDKDKA